MKREGIPFRGPARARIAAAGPALALPILLAVCSVAPDGVLVQDAYEAQNRAVHGDDESVDTAPLLGERAGMQAMPDARGGDLGRPIAELLQG